MSTKNQKKLSPKSVAFAGIMDDTMSLAFAGWPSYAPKKGAKLHGVHTIAEVEKSKQ